MFDDEEARRRRELEAARQEEAKLREKLDKLKQKTRSAKSRLNSTTKHETWHAHRLAHLDRLAGYTGEMASARIFVRSLSFGDYFNALRPFAENMNTSNVLEIEFAAVQHNLDAWHVEGEKIVLDRERKAVEADRAKWEEYQSKHPDMRWRERPMTRRQYFLVLRTADHLGVEAPRTNLTRGEAFDWLDQHGANLRLRRNPEPSSAPPAGPSSRDIASVEGRTELVDRGAGEQSVDRRHDGPSGGLL